MILGVKSLSSEDLKAIDWDGQDGQDKIVTLGAGRWALGAGLVWFCLNPAYPEYPC